MTDTTTPVTSESAVTAEPVATSKTTAHPDVARGTGRRKSAVARVLLKPGAGEITVNGRPADEYFARYNSRVALIQPLLLAELEDKLDITVNVRGGGESGQAGAVRHGISRALLEYDGELRTPLKRAGFLTRDARAKERKKYGQPGARKRYQFSKR